MAGIQVNRIVNANIYLNGVNKVGTSEEVKLGDLAAKMEEVKALGLVGTFKLPTGFEAIEGSIKWNGFYPENAGVLANPFNVVSLQVRCNLETHTSQGIASERPMVTFLSVRFFKSPLGAFQQHQNAEFESSMEILYVKQVVDGVELLEFDVMNNIFKIDGVDILANYRANTGA